MPFNVMYSLLDDKKPFCNALAIEADAAFS